MIRRINGKLILYVMEPDEELGVLQFLDKHREETSTKHNQMHIWLCSARELGLKGGHDRMVSNLFRLSMSNANNWFRC